MGTLPSDGPGADVSKHGLRAVLAPVGSTWGNIDPQVWVLYLGSL